MYSLNVDMDFGGRDDSGNRQDLAFIMQYQWQSPDHLKAAIQIVLSARLHESASRSGGDAKRTTTLATKLQESEQRLVRKVLANNPNTPPAVLCYLAATSDAGIVADIATHPRAPRRLLSELASSAAAEVRQGVAENLHTPEFTLEILAFDAHPDVRYCLAENPRMPSHILKALGGDENPFVAAKSHDTLNRIEGGQVVTRRFARRDVRKVQNG